MLRRPLVLAVWVAGTMAAMTIAVFGVNLAGARVTGRLVAPISADQVAEAAAGAPPSSTSTVGVPEPAAGLSGSSATPSASDENDPPGTAPAPDASPTPPSSAGAPGAGAGGSAIVGPGAGPAPGGAPPGGAAGAGASGPSGAAADDGGRDRDTGGVTAGAGDASGTGSGGGSNSTPGGSGSGGSGSGSGDGSGSGGSGSGGGSPGGPPTTATTAPLVPQSQTFSLVGGTATLTCTGPSIRVDRTVPAAGFAVKPNSLGPASDVTVEFERRDPSHRSRLRASCSGGLPRATETMETS